MTDAPDRSCDKAGGDTHVAASLELREEQAGFSRQVVAGATVRVATTTLVREQKIDEALAHETVEIERVQVGRVVKITPDVRQEGDVTIVPVMEEVLVLARRLILKEEVRIRRVRTTEAHRETVQLRYQEAIVTRTDAACATADDKQPDTQTPDNGAR